MDGRTVTVTDAAGLRAALAAAKGGETILLAPGSYGFLDIAGLRPGAAVTLRPAGEPGSAALAGLRIRDSASLRVEGLHVDGPNNLGPGGKVVSVEASRDIAIANCEVNAKVDADFLNGFGIHVSGGSERIRIEANTVHDVKDGVAVFGARDVTVSGNRVDRLGSDGFKFSGVTGLLVENNEGARHIFPQPDAHKDFMQFQGDTTDVIVRGNVFLAGDQIWVQGLFFGNGVHRNVLIEQNIIHTGMLNGIVIYEGSGITVRHNTVLNTAGTGHKATTISVPAGSIVEHNIWTGNAGGLQGTNLVAQNLDPKGPFHYGTLFADALDPAWLVPADLRPLPGSAAATRGAVTRLLELLGEGGTAPAPNRAPEAADDAASLFAGDSITFRVLDNDRDPDGDTLVVTGFTRPGNGTLVQNRDGSFTYTPAPGFAGQDGFSYTVSDGRGGSDTAAVTLEVTARPAPGGVPASLPAAGLVARFEADAGVLTGAGNLVLGWKDGSGRGNDLRAAGDPRLLASATPTGRPAVEFDGTGDLLQRLAATDPLAGLPKGAADRTLFLVVRYHDAEGVAAGLVYGDGARNEAFGLVTHGSSGRLMVQGWGNANDHVAAEAGTGAGWMVQSVVLEGNLLRHFRNGSLIDTRSHGFRTDLQKLVLGAEIAGLGEARLDIAAALIYDRALGEAERRAVEAWLQDKYLTGPRANLAPLAADDTALAAFGNPVTIDVLANDSDPDGDAPVLVSVGPALHGRVAIDDRGTADRADDRVLYAPDPGFAGEDVFLYRIADGKGGEAEARVTVTVTAPPGEVFALPGSRDFSGKWEGVLQVRHSSAFAIAEGTVSFTFTPDDAVRRQGLVCKDSKGATEGGLLLWIEGGRLLARFEAGGETVEFAAGGITAGRSHAVVASFGAEGVALWLDGRLVGSDDLAMDWTRNRDFLQVGADGSGRDPGKAGFSHYFDGRIADLVLHDAALAPADLLLL